MQAIIKDVTEVLEHLTYSHTFRSEKTANRVRELLGRIRDALEPGPAEPEPPAAAPEQAAAPVPEAGYGG